MLFRICFLLSVGLSLGLSGTAASDPVSVYAVWAQPLGNRTTTIQYANMVGGNWSEPRQLQINRGLHVTPSIAVDREKNIWIIWIEQTTEENILRYAIVRKGKTETGRVGSVGGEESFAPAIIIDYHNVPWIAWSGVTGKLADIYASRWNGSGWEEKQMVNKVNETPDITPILGLHEKRSLWLSWFGFSEAHNFVQYHAQQVDGKWRVDKTTSPSKDVKQFIAQRIKTDILFPGQAEKRLMGGIFAGSDNEIQSISDQFISFQTEEKQ